MIHMEYYLVVSTIMMFVGIYGFVTRRNLLAMLISVELILNSVDINFVVFNRFLFPGALELLLRAVRHRGECRGDGRRHRHHHQHLPQHPQYPGPQPAPDEVVTIPANNDALWNIRF